MLLKTAHLFILTLLLGGTSLVVLGRGRAAQAPAQVGPEHRVLEQWVGRWRASVGGPGGSGAAPSSAKSSVRLAGGGLWMLTDYEGTADGAPFSGHEVRGFDPAAKAYVVSWVDSMSPSFNLGQGSWDEKTKTMAFAMEGTGPDGKPATWRQTDVWTDADTHVWTMFRSGPDGQEAAVLEITYRRDE